MSVYSVSVYPSSVTIRKGEWYYGAYATVRASSNCCTDVTWYSDKTAVATVNATTGYIYGRSAGTARIYAQSKVDSSKWDYITVNVTNGNICVDSVCLNYSYLSLEKGDRRDLSATVCPANATNKSISWSSSNPAVATVSGGTVRAVGVGGATITARAQDGSGEYDTCYVRVTGDILVSSVSINPSSKTMTVGDSAYLYESVCPTNATNKCVRWSSSNTNVIFVNGDGLVTAKKAGNATVYATAQDGSGKRGSCSIKVTDYAPPFFVTMISDGVINYSNILKTNDGFFMLDKSLADILNEYCIYNLYTSETGTKTRYVQGFYDDWYIFAVKNGSRIKYGLIKMREQEFDNDDGNDPGVTVSFVNFNLNTFQVCKNYPSKINTFYLLETLDSVTGPGISEHDPDIVKYFSETKSKAPYLIAEKYIDFIAHLNCNGIINAPNTFIAVINEMDSIKQQLKNSNLSDTARLVLTTKLSKLNRVPKWLEQNNQKAGYNIFDLNTLTISICDADNLSIYEKYAILSVFTADVNFNSFAAEVEFHADALNDWKANIPILGNKWYEAALRADMATGEDVESGFFDTYYDLNSDIVKAQAAAHGEY